MENILNCLRATYRAASRGGEEKEGGREREERRPKGGTPTHDYNNNSSELPFSQQTELGNGILQRMRKRCCELIISINIPHHRQMWANSDSCQVHTVHNTQTVTWYPWRSNVTYRHVRRDTTNSLLILHGYYHSVLIDHIYECEHSLIYCICVVNIQCIWIWYACINIY